MSSINPSDDRSGNQRARYLETQLQELEKQFQQLTARIEALDRNIGRELDSEKELVLRQRHREVADERDQVSQKMAKIERERAETEPYSGAVGPSPAQPSLPGDHDDQNEQRETQKAALPAVFMASSPDALHIGQHMGELLEKRGIAKLIESSSEGVFQRLKRDLDSVKDTLQKTDFVVHVLGPNTSVPTKGAGLRTIRDKLLLDLGVSIGVLGHERTIVLANTGNPLMPLPTDLRGMTVVNYDPNMLDGNLDAALEGPYQIIGGLIQKQGFIPRPPLKVRPLTGPKQKDRRTDDALHLITDSTQLLEMYMDEKPIRASASELPYSEIKVWGVDLSNSATEVAVQVEHKGEFFLRYVSMSHKLFQVQAYAQLLAWGKIDKDEPMVRLRNWIPAQDGGTDVLEIQRAMYSDQVQSNIVLHWPTSDNLWEGWHGLAEPFLPKDGIHLTLSGLLSDNPDQPTIQCLPPLSGNRSEYLANTIGVSIILFYRKDGAWVPLVQDRSNETTTAVYNKGWHVSASFALGFWKETSEATSLRDLVNEQLVTRIRTEAYIQQDELGVLTPLALCREFMRGGKPQLFYAGYIKNLSEREIEERFRSDRKAIHLYTSYRDINNELRRSPDNRNRYTTEFLANWHYCSRYYVTKLEASGI